MRTYDLSPLFRSSVGFDHMARMLDGLSSEAAPAYPPYNIEKTGEDAYRITMAVAGFGDKDLEIRTQENKLVITGRIEKDADAEQRTFLHRGIAERAFERQFSLENGLLHVDLAREVPEAMKPRTIEINTANGKSRRIQSNAA